MSDHVRIARSGAVLHLTLHRPEKLNALTTEMAGTLHAALVDAADDDGVRAVLLDAAGRAFCAGQDLSDPAVAPGADLGATIERAYNPLIRAMRALPKPIVAAVNGIAAGAGANLAFAADLVLAARSASFVEAFVRIGLMPDSGGTWMLPRVLGHARAVGVAMLGETFDAERALAWGALWQVVDDEQLAACATELVERLAAMPTRALGTIKRLMEAGWSKTLDAQLDAERDAQRALGGGFDFAEGVAAFSAKRPARFDGR